MVTSRGEPALIFFGLCIGQYGAERDAGQCVKIVARPFRHAHREVRVLQLMLTRQRTLVAFVGINWMWGILRRGRCRGRLGGI